MSRLLLQLFVCIGLGCASESEAPRSLVEIQDGLVESVSLQLNGVDPQFESVSLPQNKLFDINASYVRADTGDVDWTEIMLLFVNDDHSKKTDGIQFQKRVGLRQGERKKNKKLQWDCRLMNGEIGRQARVSVKPGEYEVRLCWKRSPKSVAEKQIELDNPTVFLTPFYTARIQVE